LQHDERVRLRGAGKRDDGFLRVAVADGSGVEGRVEMEIDRWPDRVQRERHVKEGDVAGIVDSFEMLAVEAVRRVIQWQCRGEAERAAASKSHGREGAAVQRRL